MNKKRFEGAGSTGRLHHFDWCRRGDSAKGLCGPPGPKAIFIPPLPCNESLRLRNRSDRETVRSEKCPGAGCSTGPRFFRSLCPGPLARRGCFVVPGGSPAQHASVPLLFQFADHRVSDHVDRSACVDGVRIRHFVPRQIVMDEGVLSRSHRVAQYLALLELR